MDRNLGQLENFMEVYEPALTLAVTRYRHEYGFGTEHVPTVVARMRTALLSGSYHHEGRAFKATCKALGIKHTRRAIEAYLQSPI